MKRMISHIALSTLLLCSCAAANAQETETAPMRKFFNRISSEISRIGGFMWQQPSEKVAAPVKVEAPKSPNFVKRGVNSVVSAAKATSGTVSSSVTCVGNTISKAYTESRKTIAAHPVKFTAWLTAMLAGSGALGYGIYTYVQQHNAEAEANR